MTDIPIRSANLKAGDRLIVAVDGRFGELGADLDAECLNRLRDTIQQFAGPDVQILLLAGASVALIPNPEGA